MLGSESILSPQQGGDIEWDVNVTGKNSKLKAMLLIGRLEQIEADLKAAWSNDPVVHTDGKGYFAASSLVPGSYDVHVSAPSFLPTLREDVVLAAGASKILNITLNTLFEAVSMLPPLKKNNDENDSWKWTLRNTANRPVLRFDGDTALIVETQQEGQQLKGTLALMAGAASEGYGSASDLGTAFSVEQ